MRLTRRVPISSRGSIILLRGILELIEYKAERGIVPNSSRASGNGMGVPI